MSYAIIALFPTADAKPITQRPSLAAARATCQALNRIYHLGEYQNAFFRFVDATKPYCNRCGKQDLDNAQGCLQPSVFSPAVGDWVCNLSTKTVDN